MTNFNRGGRGLPFGQSYVCSKMQNKDRLLRLRLLADPRNDERTVNRNDEMWRSGVLLIIFCVLCNWFLVSPALGQEANGLDRVQPLTIGSKVPPEFWTKEHLFYVNGDTIRRTLEEYKGKLLVLDFYMSGCGSCMLHQQEITFYKQKYPKEIAVIMVNSRKTKEDYDKIDKLFASGYFRRFSIDSFSSIIEDGYLAQLFPYHSYPSYFWINQSGILQTHTYRNLLDRNYSAPFL